MDLRMWGFKINIKWVLVNVAPLTASGLNEIIAGAETRKELLKIAKALDVKLTRRGEYAIVKLDDVPQKEQSV